MLVKGKIGTRNDELQIVVDEIEMLDGAKAKRQLHIKISDIMKETDLAHLRTTLAVYKGEEPICLHIGSDVGSHSCTSTLSPGAAARLAKQLNLPGPVTLVTTSYSALRSLARCIRREPATSSSLTAAWRARARRCT